MGIAAGVVALAALIVLLAGLISNYVRVRALRERRDELDGRVIGLETRLAQLAEQERRQALARQRAAQTPVPAPVAVRRVPSPALGRPPVVHPPVLRPPAPRPPAPLV